MKSLGNHLIIELYDCKVDIINDLHKVEDILMESVNISGAEIITPVFHKFNPHGVSGVVVIAESHFSIHTWPEYGYCAVAGSMRVASRVAAGRAGRSAGCPKPGRGLRGGRALGPLPSRWHVSRR